MKKSLLTSFISHLENTIKLPFRRVRARVLRKKIPITRTSIRYVAHRGLSAEAPENTVRAFLLAGQRGFDAMETDIRRTKDGHLVLMHDDSMKRMCGVDKRVCDLTRQELAEIPVTGGRRADEWKEDPDARRVPDLKEYLVICRDYDMVPMMELKDKWNLEEPLEDEYLRQIAHEVKEVMENRPIIFVSFNLKSLIALKRVLAQEGMGDQAMIHHLVKKMDMSRLEDYLSKGIHLSIKGSSNKLRDIRRAREAGIRLVVWTVDDEDDARLYIRERVDWLASNRQLWS